MKKFEMRNEIKSWLKGVPSWTFREMMVDKIGRDYVHTLSLYEGSKIEKVTIEEFYDNFERYIANNIYQ